MVAGGAHEDMARVGDLGGDHVGGDGDGGGFVIGAAVLFPAEQDVAGGEAVGGGEEFAVGVVKRQRDPGFGTSGHERGGARDVPAKTGDAIEVVQGHAELGHALVADLDGGSVLAEVSAFEGDEQGVEVAAHGDFRVDCMHGSGRAHA